MTLPELEKVKAIVIEVAQRELPHRFAHMDPQKKADGSLITEADLATQAGIRSALEQLCPGCGFLGEEMEAAEQLAAMEGSPNGLWCLDPLDGTNNFTAGIPYYAVSLAFLHKGEVQLGVVYDPSRDECFSAIRGQGARLNDAPLTGRTPVVPLQSGIGVIDFKRLSPELITRLAESPPYASQRSFGAVALDWCWLAAGRFHVYLHGKQKLWDYAAGSLILSEAGGHAITLTGEPVYQPSLESRSSVAALDKDMFDQWREWLRIK